MATYEADVYGARVKVRDVGIVILLTAVTLSVYNWFWYFRINRELRDFGRVYRDDELANVQPGLSVLATTLGALLIVPAIVSWYRCTGRIRRAQRIVGADLTHGWVIVGIYAGAFLIPLAALAIPAYVQEGLNDVWKRYPRVPEQ